MIEFDYKEAFSRLLKYYYNECPGRIMPLLLLYLARASKANKPLVYIEEKYRPDLNWETEPEKRYTGFILSQFTRENAKDLAETDPAGRQILERWYCNEMDHMSIVVIQESERIQEIRTFFQKRDEQLGDDWKTRKALFTLVQGLQSIPQQILAENYLMFCNMLLQEAKVLDEMEDYDLAMFEKWLIGKSVKGNVFVAQSKTPFTAATFSKANVITESAKQNADLESMVSYLLIHGNGCPNVKTTAVEKPFVAEADEQYDLVIMNRSADNRRTRYSDWHECYKNIKAKLSDTGRFYGLVKNKNLFAMLDKQSLFKEAIDSKELDTIILLPKKYGCSIVTINKAKKSPNYVSLVDLYNEDICLDVESDKFGSRYATLVKYHKKKIAIDVLQKAQSKIHLLFDHKLPATTEKDNLKLVQLSKYLKRITPYSSFAVERDEQNEQYNVINIDHSKPYSPYDYEVSSESVHTFSLFHNYYYLDGESLIVNRKGDLNSRYYDGRWVPAYINTSESIVFTILSYKIDPAYIVNELRKPYVQAQLDHWTRSSDEIHSEDQILNLKIYVPVDEDIETEKEICKLELDRNILPNGHKIINRQFPGSYDVYTIKKCLGRGGFGISYLADRYNYITDETTEVVIKEYMPSLKGQEGHRDENNWVSLKLGDTNRIRGEFNTFMYLIRFLDEADAMMYFRKFPDCKIRRACDLFKSDKTNTYYIVMDDYYPCGTLLDEINNCDPFHKDEKAAIQRIMIPLATALKTMHDNRWLHLDLKAENVIIDNEGYAILGDLGVSQQYDENGEKISRGAITGSDGACDLQFNPKYNKVFRPEFDVYSLAALYYLMLTGDMNHEAVTAKSFRKHPWISEASKNAILTALDPKLETTPKCVEDFIHLLPGCDNINLPKIDEVAETKISIDDSAYTEFDDIDVGYIDTGDLPTGLLY